MKRGEIYYISIGSIAETGSEQRAGRPAVIVSNDHLNDASSVVEVVYLTTQDKPDLKTHVTVRGTGRTSTVLCEQICSVSKKRIGEYAGECTADEMERIDIALMESLDLEYKDDEGYGDCEEPEGYDYEEVDAETDEDEPILPIEVARELIRLEAERDTYKELYESLLTKMMIYKQ